MTRLTWARGKGLMLAAACLAGGGLWVHPGPAQADNWRTPREALDRRAQRAELSVYYTGEGDNAFRADYVAPLLDQMSAAKQYYEQQLGLQSPLLTPRYQGQLRGIDVHVLRMQGSNGSAGDAAVHYRYRTFGDLPGRALTITIGAHWSPANLTPAHELFHSYQYGYTLFKNGWFLEGMARALEHPIEGGGGPVAPLPSSRSDWNGMVGKRYGAEVFWTRLMQVCEPVCTPARTAFARPCGGALVRSTLEAFQQMDAVASADRGLDPHDWPEAEQRSPANIPYMARGLLNAVGRTCTKPWAAELETFATVLEGVAVPAPQAAR